MTLISLRPCLSVASSREARGVLPFKSLCRRKPTASSIMHRPIEFQLLSTLPKRHHLYMQSGLLVARPGMQRDQPSSFALNGANGSSYARPLSTAAWKFAAAERRYANVMHHPVPVASSQKVSRLPARTLHNFKSLTSIARLA